MRNLSVLLFRLDFEGRAQPGVGRRCSELLYPRSRIGEIVKNSDEAELD